MSQIPARSPKHAKLLRDKISANGDYVALTPDFPFDYKAFLNSAGSDPIGTIADENKGKKIAIVGAGVAGITAAYEAMRMGLVPVIFEAQDRIGGRFFSKRFEGQGSLDNLPIAELGAMRFSQHSKTIVHYFKKAGMWNNKAHFPNPGTGWVPGNIIDYRGKQSYYEVDPKTGKIVAGKNPYAFLSDKFYGNDLPDSGLMERNGLQLSQAQKWQMPDAGGTVPEESKIALRDHWRNLLRGIGTKNSQSFDTKSFRDLFTDDGWSFKEIEAFGQIGFGTGGWGSDFIDSSVEVLRVIYMGLDSDQWLMLDGTDTLTSTLFSTPPVELGDKIAGSDPTETLEKIQYKHHSDHTMYNKEVIGFSTNGDDSEQENITVHFRDESGTPREHPEKFEAVVYTSHVRVFDKLRYQSPNLKMQADTYNLLDSETWEAIMYTHYQQSTKVFQAVDSPFWNERDPVTKEYEMSQTLSDRLTRGTYLLDYSKNTSDHGNKGAGVFMSYTWADDSAKFLTTDNKESYSSWVNMTKNCLDEIYNKRYPSVTDVFRGHASEQPTAGKKWDDDPHFIMAFKYNLPGQYRYQKTLFQNFFCAAKENRPDTKKFVFAGDGISWTAAWAEGACQSAINAVSKLEYLFNGNRDNPASPHGQYLTWQPIDIPDPKPTDIPDPALSKKKSL